MAKKYPHALRNMFYFFEKSDFPSLGPNILQMEFCGFWYTKDTKYLRFKKFMFYLCLTIFFNCYIKFILNPNIDNLLLLIQYAPLHVTLFKFIIYKKDHKHWESLYNFTAKLEKEQFANKDSAIDRILNTYILRCRHVCYYYWLQAVVLCSIIITSPYFGRDKDEIDNNCDSYVHLLDIYSPFGEETPGCYYALAIEVIACNVMALYLVAWNTIVRTILIFFAGQLKLAKLYGQRLIEVGNVEKSHKNISEFHKFYMSLIEYQKLFNSIISSSMFLYEIVTAINLSANIIQFFQFSKDENTSTSSAILNSGANGFGCFMELFLIYYFSSKVSEESEMVSYAMFTCDWVGADLRLQREVALLAIATAEEIVFDSGPFHKMTLEAYVKILQGSYSFFALINNT